MDLPAYLAKMVKSFLEIIVFVLLLSHIGMDIVVLPVQLIKSGHLLRTLVVAKEANTGMDSFVFLVQVQGHGILL